MALSSETQQNKKIVSFKEMDFQVIGECFQYIQNKFGAFPDKGTNYGTFVHLGH